MSERLQTAEVTYALDCAQCRAERALAVKPPESCKGFEHSFLCGVYGAELKNIARPVPFKMCSRHRRARRSAHV